MRTTTYTYGFDGSSKHGDLAAVAYSSDPVSTPGASYIYLPNQPIVYQLDLKETTNLRLSTIKQYDTLNRLQTVFNTPQATGALPVVFDYAYNSANQRQRRDEYKGTGHSQKNLARRQETHAPRGLRFMFTQIKSVVLGLAWCLAGIPGSGLRAEAPGNGGAGLDALAATVAVRPTANLLASQAHEMEALIHFGPKTTGGDFQKPTFLEFPL